MIYHLQSALNKKCALTKWCIIFTGILILLRLFYLQIQLHSHFANRGEKNFLRIEYIPSQRGNIIDRNGALLVTNRPVVHVYWQGTGNRSLPEQQQNILNCLNAILKIPITENPNLMNGIIHAERFYKQILIATDINFEQLSQLEEQLPNHPNISLTTHFQRYYPHTTCASHLVGYLSGQTTPEFYGKMGLEKLLEDTLKGKEGTIVKTINSVGRSIENIKVQDAYAGTDIQITIDLALQQICERVFPPDNAGTMIIMDPQDGALLTVVSRPAFDPNIFLHPISVETWQAMQEQRPFINRAFNACYPPGSIFKLITTSALLEHHIISPTATIYCKGYVSFAGRRYWCNQRHGHGTLTIQEAIAESCNTLFFEIGKHIDIDLIAHYAYKFGLGKKTDIAFQENSGIVPSRAWKRLVKKEPWWPGETLSATIGQSFLLATPIQIACMISSIFTGFLVKPRILMDESVHKRPLNLASETRPFLKKVMKKTVTNGTAKKLSKLKNIRIYAKTSTAQTSSLDKRHLGSAYLEHGWFAGYVQYKQHNPLTIIILVENVGSSQIPIVVAKEFLLEYQNYCDQNTTSP